MDELCGDGVPMDSYTAASLGINLKISRSIDDRQGWNELMFAVYYHRKEMIDILVKDPSMMVSQIKHVSKHYQGTPRPQTTLLCLCVLCADINTLKLIYSVDKTDERDSVGRTPLHLAVETNQINIVQFLLENGADPNKICRSLTCLGEASRQGNIELIKLLLDFKGNISVCDQVNTPLTLALESGNMAAVYLLLKHISENYSLEELFKQINMEKYWPKFQQKNISYQQFITMTESDLKNYGVSLLGPRKKLACLISLINSN